MARKPKARKEPIVNKMYVWELEVEDRLVEWKCFVGEDECVTYEGDRECKRLKIMDKTQQEGLLQIDTKTRVWDEVLPFQLENGIPYIQIDGKWVSSDTTKEDRLQQRIRNVKIQSYMMLVYGIALLIVTLVQYLTKSLGEFPVAPVLACMCFVACASNLVRLRNELLAMGRSFSIKL